MAIGRTNQLMQRLGSNALSDSQKSAINGGLNRNIFEPTEQEQMPKTFQIGQGNKAMQGLNKAIGERVYGNTGQGLIDSDWLKGGGATLGKLADAFGQHELGAALSESPYLSGNLMSAAGQAASDLGATELGSVLTEAGGSSLAGGASGIISKLLSFL